MYRAKARGETRAHLCCVDECVERSIVVPLPAAPPASPARGCVGRAAAPGRHRLHDVEAQRREDVEPRPLRALVEELVDADGLGDAAVQLGVLERAVDAAQLERRLEQERVRPDGSLGVFRHAAGLVCVG